MSIGGVAKSVSGAFTTGFNAGVGRGLSVKGIGTMAGMGITGATIGASTAALASDGTVDPLSGAVVGGAVGAMTLPATGLAMGAIGTVGVGMAKAAPTIGSAIGKGTVASSPFIAAVGAKVGANAATSVWNIGSSIIDWNGEGKGSGMFGKVKMSNPISGAKAGWAEGKGKLNKVGKATRGALVNGATVLGTVAAVEGVQKAWGTVKSAHMGQMTGTATLTPQVPSYSNNAGATGDLVFALNANRRG